MRPDEIVDTLAATQHGVVARHQLLTAGMSRQAIDRHVAAGRLLVIHPAVCLDSYRHHSTRSDWAGDHVRNRQLTSIGWRVLPVTWEDLAQPSPFLAAVSRGLDILPRVAG